MLSKKTAIEKYEINFLHIYRNKNRMVVRGNEKNLHWQKILKKSLKLSIDKIMIKTAAIFCLQSSTELTIRHLKSEVNKIP